MPAATHSQVIRNQEINDKCSSKQQDGRNVEEDDSGYEKSPVEKRGPLAKKVQRTLHQDVERNDAESQNIIIFDDEEKRKMRQNLHHLIENMRRWPGK